ncbi:unnamed protein product [Caretta caretta]
MKRPLARRPWGFQTASFSLQTVGLDSERLANPRRRQSACAATRLRSRVLESLVEKWTSADWTQSPVTGVTAVSLPSRRVGTAGAVAAWRRCSSAGERDPRIPLRREVQTVGNQSSQQVYSCLYTTSVLGMLTIEAELKREQLGSVYMD